MRQKRLNTSSSQNGAVKRLTSKSINDAECFFLAAWSYNIFWKVTLSSSCRESGSAPCLALFLWQSCKSLKPLCDFFTIRFSTWAQKRGVYRCFAVKVSKAITAHEREIDRIKLLRLTQLRCQSTLFDNFILSPLT